jgi:hypothetical protein
MIGVGVGVIMGVGVPRVPDVITDLAPSKPISIPEPAAGETFPLT